MQPLACDMWLMERSAFRQFVNMLSVDIKAEDARAMSAVSAKTQRNVAILPISGPLEARASFWGSMFGMQSYEGIGAEFDSLMGDESLKAIVLDVNSPGGMVYGAQELADKIYRARGKGKQIIAVANPVAASAAFWVASAADRLIVTPSGDVGSVGVIAQHLDVSAALEKEGAKVTTIKSAGSPYKGEGGEYEPLSDEAKAHFQSRADTIYAKFTADLAKFRNTTIDDVNENFGKGRTVSAMAAKKAGMVDRVDTMEGVVRSLFDGRYRMGERAELDVWDAPTRREVLLAKSESLLLAAKEPVIVEEKEGIVK